MNKNKSLEYIANGIQAAYKINALRSTNLRGESNSNVKQDRLSRLSEMVQVITEFAPDTNKKALSDVLQKTSLYSHTYRSLKQQLTSVNNRNINLNHIMQTLAVVKPTLNSRNQVSIEKILKIFQILNS